jgi:hypothetical protein
MISAVPLGLAVALATATPVATPEKHIVTRITVDGRSVSSTGDVGVVPPGDAEPHEWIAKGQALVDGTSISIPNNVVVYVTAAGRTIAMTGGRRWVLTENGPHWMKKKASKKGKK